MSDARQTSDVSGASGVSVAGAADTARDAGAVGAGRDARGTGALGSPGGVRQPPAAAPLSLAWMPGDGIGPEVTAVALEVLERASSRPIEVTRYPHGAEHYLATGEILSDSDLAALAAHDAILFGAVGGDPADPRLAGGIIERGLLLKLRFAFDHYVNLRPTRLLPGVVSPLANPGEIDFVVVREGTEGPYVGNGGALRVGTPHEIANETSVNTAMGAERVVRFAFEQAEARRGRLTLVHKKNVLTHAGGLWQRIVDEVAREHPDVAVDYLHVDAATIFLVQNPARFDVIVTDNLFGDILTDLAGAISGGIGVAASGNLNPTGAYPSMFEPVHGSAPDIAGRGIADPTAAILSAAMLLRACGQGEDASRIERAVEAVAAKRAGLGAAGGDSGASSPVRERPVASLGDGASSPAPMQGTRAIADAVLAELG